MFKALNLWLPDYARRGARPAVAGVTDLLLAVCDHFEPRHAADEREALARLKLWQHEFPRLIEPFRDADGVRPRHTFFYPVEQYEARHLDEIAELCRLSGGEVEIHLHHDRDTAAGLVEKIERGKNDLLRHGFLSRDAQGAVRYGFVHGDWAIGNSHPAGRHCGVENELAVLRRTGCYADFTMPSAPSGTQARRVNRLYYAPSTPAPRAHDHGEAVRVRANAPLPPATSADRPGENELLMVPGPLGFNWEWRKFGILPRIETSDLTGALPPQPHRLRVWERIGVHVEGRPEWVFIKLHTHGAVPRNSGMLLGEPMRQFHAWLRDHRNDGQHYRLHYVTARELVNILHAAEAGHAGNPGQYRDYRYRRTGAA